MDVSKASPNWRPHSRRQGPFPYGGQHDCRYNARLAPNKFRRRALLKQLGFATGLTLSALVLGADELPIAVGVAQIDVSPDYPIRLTGYAVRKTESQGVEQRLWAKALAIGSDP